MTFLSQFDLQFGPRLALPDRPRHESFRAMFAWLEEHCQAPYTIMETGCVRKADAWSDGMSTVLFDQFLRVHGGQLISIDRSEEHCRIARTLVNGHSRIINGDSVETLHRFAADPGSTAPDLLYLDSMDVD